MSLFAFLAFYFFVHRPASLKAAAKMEVTVEGSFFRIRTYHFLHTDRKVHFRSIVDYATTEDSFMRYFGIAALELSTMGGGRFQTITIPGVKDCLAVRDMLSEIDRLRE